MSVSNDFIAFVLDQLSSWGNVHIKRMFGGVALYQEELAFGMIANNVVYLKVDDSNKDNTLRKIAYRLSHLKTMRPYCLFTMHHPMLLKTPMSLFLGKKSHWLFKRNSF